MSDNNTSWIKIKKVPLKDIMSKFKNSKAVITFICILLVGTVVTIGELYKFPSEFKAQKAVAVEHSLQISNINKVLLTNTNAVNRLETTVSDIYREQKALSSDAQTINKNLVEVITTLKFHSEAMKEIKADLKDLK